MLVCYPMKLATTPQEQRQWMAQWRETAVALEEARRHDLVNLSEAEALRRSEDVLSLPELWRRPGQAGLGLVEQQQVFSRWPKQ